MIHVNEKSEVTYAARCSVTSLYVHVPFCHDKCGYCDFYSIAGAGDDLVDAWHEGIRTELQRIGEEAYDHGVMIEPLETIYFGGGTPSFLSPDIIASIIAHAKSLFMLKDCCDITLEANPESIAGDLMFGESDRGRETAHRWVEPGINRVSFGMQSATDSLLRLAGRRHTCAQAVEAVRIAADVGFRDISVDLMTGLPSQTVEDIEYALQTIAQLPVNHVSSYALTVEEGTPFYFFRNEHPARFPDDEAERLMNRRLTDGLLEFGFTHYELSNFALSGAESKHNLVYWNADPYLAAGPAAASYMGGIRRRNETSIERWLANVYDAAQGPYGQAIVEEVVDESAARVETMILGLRLMRGVSRSRFQLRHNIDYDDVFGDQMARLEERGLLERSDECVCLTAKGFDFADVVAREFL
ncbi:MAG: radical SAM family heme chaperone HemW [Saccharofermentanales bacterium]|jgi:oxygen-independent coproporphyrinogen-3 oxidase